MSPAVPPPPHLAVTGGYGGKNSSKKKPRQWWYKNCVGAPEWKLLHGLSDTENSYCCLFVYSWGCVCVCVSVCARKNAWLDRTDRLPRNASEVCAFFLFRQQICRKSFFWQRFLANQFARGIQPGLTLSGCPPCQILHAKLLKICKLQLLKTRPN